MWVFFCSSPNGINLCLLYIPYIGKKKPTNTICKLAKLRVVFVGGESNSALCLVNFGYLKNVFWDGRKDLDKRHLIDWQVTSSSLKPKNPIFDENFRNSR